MNGSPWPGSTSATGSSASRSSEAIAAAPSWVKPRATGCGSDVAGRAAVVGRGVGEQDGADVAERAGVSPETVCCWVLTGATPFIQLTVERGWEPAAYQNWSAGMLVTTLLDT